MAAKNYLVCRLGTERELEVHKNAGAESLLSAGEMLVEVCDNRRIDGIDWAYFECVVTLFLGCLLVRMSRCFLDVTWVYICVVTIEL